MIHRENKHGASSKGGWTARHCVFCFALVGLLHRLLTLDVELPPIARAARMASVFSHGSLKKVQQHMDVLCLTLARPFREKVPLVADSNLSGTNESLLSA